MKKILLIAALAIVTAIAVLLVPNPLGSKIIAEAKYQGYIPYTTDEALTIAYSRCSTCHGPEKMLKYCARCGPPFIVVSHSMKKYVELTNQKGSNFRPFSDAELVAITQVWNGLVGNWEAGWGEKNIKKLLQGDAALIRLFETPLEGRPIELAMKNKSAPGAHKEESKNP
ncbi:MAG: hypothetical protein OEV35_01920 [Gallionellaceae bacterium]|nr:hypothetical protein [Gallionellaceae bacterium]